MSKNSKIIDIGCGSGWLTRDLARTIKNGEIVGIDILESSIQKVRAIAEKDTSFDYHNLTYKVANVESIPYPDKYFHLATTIASFSFWNDPIKSLKEIRRILKVNGKLIISDVHEEGSNFVSNIVRLSNTFVSDKYQEKIYTLKEFKDFLENAGFNMTHKELMGTALIIGTKKNNVS